MPILMPPLLRRYRSKIVQNIETKVGPVWVPVPLQLCQCLIAPSRGLPDGAVAFFLEGPEETPVAKDSCSSKTESRIDLENIRFNPD